MHFFSRLREYQVLFYRIFLVFAFYFIARALFTIYNYQLLGEPSLLEFFRLAYYGLIFDSSAIVYLNVLFVLGSILPLFVNTKASFQKGLFYLYFTFNLLAYASNFIDLIYFKYILSRSTISSLESVENEMNLLLLLGNFLLNYWHAFLLFFLLSWAWIYLYKLWKVKEVKVKNITSYITFSILIFVPIATLIIAAARGGDLRKSTRPINLTDANRYVKNILQANIVLNTPFAIIRTINKKAIKKIEYMPDENLSLWLNPIKQYENDSLTKPNIVLIILESMGREYLGAFNPDTEIKDFRSYSPFIDSLAQHSLIFTNAYANGYKSIHGMSSVLSGIPSYKNAFTSSPFSNQNIQSLVSVLEEEEYSTSFFHGAENGSMGFLGYSNILGIDKYIGRKEYNNDEEFDGSWGIWDEPFLQFMKEELSSEQQPFFSTVFTLSSHEPYVIPEKYKGKFPKGENAMHLGVGYADYALKRFFEEAKTEAWFDNTIFVITADHSNLIHYPEYRKPLNFHGVPILFYSPNIKIKGVNDDLAQHIDIYPTILDLIGYNKPFRSWGRSLVSSKEEPFVLRFQGGTYYCFSKDHVLLFDGEKTTGFFKSEDKALENNLMAKNSLLMQDLEKKCKAYIQDYMNRIIDNKLNENYN